MKIILLWTAILAFLFCVAFLSSWNLVLLSLIAGAVLGFLPTFILTTLQEIRKWNLENIEKIYAPLKREIDDLRIYFSDVKKGDYSGELFDYAEHRSKLLSMNEWFQIRENNLIYRIMLDDEKLLRELSGFYLPLSTYIRKRADFLETTINPIFLEINKDLSEVDIQEKLKKIKIAVTNIVLDGRIPSRDIMLGFYGFTELFSDYEKVCEAANIQEKSFKEFVVRVLKTVKGDNYNLLLEQRSYLLRDAAKIQKELKKKLKKALPT